MASVTYRVSVSAELLRDGVFGGAGVDFLCGWVPLMNNFLCLAHYLLYARSLFSAKRALISRKSIFRRFLEIKALFAPGKRRVVADRAVNTPVRFNFLEFSLGWRRCVICITSVHTAAKPAHTEEIECQHPLPKKPYRRTPRRQHALRESTSPRSPNATALTPWSIT